MRLIISALLVSCVVVGVFVTPSASVMPSQVDTSETAYLVKASKEEDKTSEIADFYKKRLESAIAVYFSKAIRQRKIIGAAVGVVKCDSIIYLGGFGKKKQKSKAKIDTATVFRIGSVSKGFAGILAGIQVQNRTLDWNDKVVEYIPNFRMTNATVTKEITLSHVLSHTTGLPYHSFTNLVEDGVGLEDIASNFDQLRTIGAPGEVYSYQNAAFGLAGLMIEKRCGISYQEELQNKLFAPLNMQNASTDYATFMNTKNKAYPHRKIFRRYRKQKINKKYYNAVAAGGVNASITDMAKYMRFLLGSHPEILDATTMAQVFSPQVAIPGRSKYYQRWKGYQSSHYAYGWRVHMFKDQVTGTPHKIIHHGGYVNNYRSEIAIYPQEDIGITVLFNSPTKLARTVIPDIRAIVEDVLSQPFEEELQEEIAQL